jgi:hypothetical protein
MKPLDISCLIRELSTTRTACYMLHHENQHDKCIYQFDNYTSLYQNSHDRPHYQTHLADLVERDIPAKETSNLALNIRKVSR